MVFTHVDDPDVMADAEGPPPNDGDARDVVVLDVVGAIAWELAGEVHVPELVATLWADGEVVVVEGDEGAAVVARRAVFDDVDAHEHKYGKGVRRR